MIMVAKVMWSRRSCTNSFTIIATMRLREAVMAPSRRPHPEERGAAKRRRASRRLAACASLAILRDTRADALVPQDEVQWCWRRRSLEIVPRPAHQVDEHVFERRGGGFPSEAGVVAVRRDRGLERCTVAPGHVQA